MGKSVRTAREAILSAGRPVEIIEIDDDIRDLIM